MNTNRLLKIQDMLFNQMKRLDDNELMNKGLGKREIQRSGAITQSASTFIKSVQTQMKIMEFAEKTKTKETNLLKDFGVIENEE